MPQISVDTAMIGTYHDVYPQSFSGADMHQTAKIFMTGRSQAVRLPVEFRFDVDEVFIRRDPDTGDVVLSRRPNNWDDLIELVRKNAGQDLSIPRRQIRELRDPFSNMKK
jgi:antitoxin VapB